MLNSNGESKMLKFLRTNKKFGGSLKVVTSQCIHITSLAVSIALSRILIKHVIVLPNWVSIVCVMAVLYRMITLPTPEIFGLTKNFILWIQVFVNGLGFFLGFGMFLFINFLFDNDILMDPVSSFENVKTICHMDASYITLFAFYYPVDVMIVSSFNGVKILTHLGKVYLIYNWRYFLKWARKMYRGGFNKLDESEEANKKEGTKSKSKDS